MIETEPTRSRTNPHLHHRINQAGQVVPCFIPGDKAAFDFRKDNFSAVVQLVDGGNVGQYLVEKKTYYNPDASSLIEDNATLAGTSSEKNRECIIRA